MTRLTRILIAVAAVIAVLVVATVAGWYFFLKSDANPRAKITKTPVVESGALDGTYRVAPGDPQSYVGYRVQEQFAGALESTATGRTSEMDGSFTIEGMTVK